MPWLAWVVGAVLCLVQLTARRSLWVDELAIVHNVAWRDARTLLTAPLAFDQVAPPGFLLLLRALTHVSSDGEVVLRLYAFLFALAALAVMVPLARVHLRGATAAIPPLIFALSGQTIWLSAQVKPYAGDAFMSASLLWCALSVPRWRRNQSWTVGVILLGIIAPWLSLPALFVLPALVLALVLDDWRGGRRLTRLACVAALVWGAGAIAVLIVAAQRVSPSTMQFMREFWSGGFPQLPPQSWNDVKWPFYTVRQVVQSLMNGAWSYLYFALVCVGVWSLWRRSRAHAAIVVLPILLALAGAALRQYPLSGRLAYFLFPVVALLLGIAADAIVRAWPRRVLVAAVVALMTLPSAAWLMRHAPPFGIQHARPLLSIIRKEARPGDIAFVPYGSWHAWSYYAPRLGLGWMPALSGACHGNSTWKYRGEVEALKSRGRTWILFVAAGRLSDPAMVTRVADRLGTRLKAYAVTTHDPSGDPRPVMLYLYDFGGRPTRPPAAPATRRAAGRPLPAPPSARECHGAAIPLAHVGSARSARTNDMLSPSRDPDA